MLQKFAIFKNLLLFASFAKSIYYVYMIYIYDIMYNIIYHIYDIILYIIL